MKRLRLRRPSPAMVVALLALAVAMSGTAYAATGGTFVLGKANTANHVSALSNAKGAALTLTSANEHTPLALNGPAEDVPPLSVSSSTLVPNLDAGLLDQASASDLSSSAAEQQSFYGPLPVTLHDPVTVMNHPILVTITGGAGIAAAANGPGFVTLYMFACPGVVASCDASAPSGFLVDRTKTFSNELNSHTPVSWSFLVSADLDPGIYAPRPGLDGVAELVSYDNRLE